MCLSPKTIINRSLHFSIEKPLMLSVPCGKCEECRRTQQNGWFVRSYFQWQECPQSTYFYTLTYNNANLPRIGSYPCFSKRSIQLFLKRLRARLQAYGISLKYIITSEYGEQYGRPHYHALFFLSSGLNPFTFYTLVEDSWQYGFVKYGDDAGLVTSYRGIKYVTKYITKDLSFMNADAQNISKYIFARYYSLFSYLIARSLIPAKYDIRFTESSCYAIYLQDGKRCENIDVECPALSKLLRKIRNVQSSAFPFHLQSTKLGLSFLDKVTPYEELSSIIKLPVSKDATPVSFSFPRYYRRALWYDVVENERDGKKTNYVLNERGRVHILESTKNFVATEVLRYKSVVANVSKIDSDILPTLNFMGYNFNNVYDLQHFISNFDLDFETMAIYSHVFRGRVCPFKSDELELTEHLVRSSYLSYVEKCLYAIPEVDFGQVSKLFNSPSFHHMFNYFLFNEHPFFVVYERSFVLFDYVDRYFRIKIEKARSEREALSRKTREYFNNMFNN